MYLLSASWYNRGAIYARRENAMNTIASGLVGIVALAWTGSAVAQGCALGANYDACFFEQLTQMQNQNNAAIQQNYYNYLQVYGPMLEREYRNWGYQYGVTFDQFAQYMLLSANGTNPQAALDAQRQQFEGLQSAHRSQVEAGQTLIDSGADASERSLAAVENNEIGSVRGNIVVNGPAGEVELPYSDVSVGQRVQGNDGYTYLMTEQGYAVWTGFGWTLLP
jgi:hypothetical protein